jgi:hypothetical protein
LVDDEDSYEYDVEGQEESISGSESDATSRPQKKRRNVETPDLDLNSMAQKALQVLRSGKTITE